MVILAALTTALAVGALGYVLVETQRSGIRRRASRRNDTVPGVDVTAGQFWFTVIGVAGVTYVVIYTLTGLVVVSLVPAMVVATLPKAYFARIRTARLAAVQEAWPDGLRDLLSSIRSGASLATATRAAKAILTRVPNPKNQVSANTPGRVASSTVCMTREVLKGPWAWGEVTFISAILSPPVPHRALRHPAPLPRAWA